MSIIKIVTLDSAPTEAGMYLYDEDGSADVWPCSLKVVKGSAGAWFSFGKEFYPLRRIKELKGTFYQLVRSAQVEQTTPTTAQGNSANA